MNDEIVLHSFSINTNNENEIEEYHEISTEFIDDLANQKPSQWNEYDFFTQHEIKTAIKHRRKKKTNSDKRKKDNSSLMDLVNTELASITVPITDNLITVCQDQETSSYLLKLPSAQSFFRGIQNSRLDYEYGRRQKETVSLSPIFPRVLENLLSNDSNIPVNYVPPTLFDDNVPDNNEIETQDKFINVSIKNVKFLQHYLFSLETLLSGKLVETYNHYVINQNRLNEANKDIRINRDTKNNIKKELLKISPNRANDIRFDETLRNYTGKIIDLKQHYIHLLKTQKSIIHKIVSIWSDIELTREKSGHTETPYILDIVNKDWDEKKYEDEWTEIYNMEFSDYLDKIEYDYVNEYLQYKDMKKEMSANNLEKKKAIRPKLNVDEEEVKEKVEEIVNKIVTKDKIDMILKVEDHIVSTHTKTAHDLMKFTYHFDVYVDDIFVCKSETFSFTKRTTFEIEFTESFSVQILPKNQSLTLVLNENNEEMSKAAYELSKIKVNGDFETIQLHFENILIQPTNKYIGSGYGIKDIAKETKVRLKSSNIFQGTLETTCQLSIKVVWNESLSEGENIKDFMIIGKELKRLYKLDKPDLNSLVNVIEKVYEKDIRNNGKIMEALTQISNSKLKNDYDLNLDDNYLDFVRLKLLFLRNFGGFNNKCLRKIPLFASQITTEQLNRLQKSNEKDIDITYISDKYSGMNPIDLQRFIGSKYVKKLNEIMLRNLHDHLMRKTHKDVVRDYRYLSLRTILSSNSILTTLSAMPLISRQQYLYDAMNKEQEIQITVLRAFNLMDRSSTILSDDNDEEDSTIAGFKVRLLRPYVQVSYRNVSCHTAAAIGCHAAWNQTVKIKAKFQPLSCLHIDVFDEYKTNINEGNSDDEVSESKTVHYRCYSKWLGTLQVPLHTVLTSGTLRGTFKLKSPPIIFGYDVLKKKDASHSLIPAVSQLLKKDASFISLQITTSLAHLEGQREYHQPATGGVDDDDLIRHLNNIVTDYTNDFPTRNISLTFIDRAGRNKCVTEFLQPIILPDYEWFPKNPKTRVESAMSKSSSSKSSAGRKRDNVDVERGDRSPEGRESLYSGFEGSWKGESQLENLMNACLRYVALIPVYEVTETHVVTSTGTELLQVLYGSPLDHTLLLASYFLYLGVKCWVAIGFALPRGHTGFLLTKYDLTMRREVLVTDQILKSRGILNKNEGYTWNVYDATTGEKFDLRDISCPLKTVDYIFDNENIWLNIQASQNCENVSFDLTKSSNWMPAFDKNIFVMKQPLVTDPSIYSSPLDLTTLRENLESKIRAKVQKWRPQQKTIWNRYCSTLLREILPHWEYWTFHPLEPEPALSQRLKQLMVTYKLFGFPLNMSYINTKAVISTVKATGLHLNDDSNIEFGLAVELYGYPNNVISVWVFFVSITRI